MLSVDTDLARFHARTEPTAGFSSPAWSDAAVRGCTRERFRIPRDQAQLLEKHSPRLLSKIYRIEAGSDSWETARAQYLALRTLDVLSGKEDNLDFSTSWYCFCQTYGVLTIRDRLVQEATISEKNWPKLLCAAIQGQDEDSAMIGKVVEFWAAHPPHHIPDILVHAMKVLDAGQRLKLKQVLELLFIIESEPHAQISYHEMGSEGPALEVRNGSLLLVRAILACLPASSLILNNIFIHQPEAFESPIRRRGDGSSECSSTDEIYVPEDEVESISSASSGVADFRDLLCERREFNGRRLLNLAEFIQELGVSGSLDRIEVHHSEIDCHPVELGLALQALPELKHVRIVDCSFSDPAKSLAPLFSYLGRLSFLQELDLQGFNLDQEEARSLGRALARLMDLRSLVLDLWQVGDASMAYILRAISLLPSLSSLFLGKRTDDRSPKIGRALKALLGVSICPLRHLALRGFSPSAFIQGSLEANLHLQSLYLREARGEEQAWKLLFKQLAAHPHLQKLDLRRMEFAPAVSTAFKALLEGSWGVEELQLKQVRFESERGKLTENQEECLGGLRALRLCDAETTKSFLDALGYLLERSNKLESLAVTVPREGGGSVLRDLARILKGHQKLKKLKLSSPLDLYGMRQDICLGDKGLESFVKIFRGLPALTQVDVRDFVIQ